MCECVLERETDGEREREREREREKERKKEGICVSKRHIFGERLCVYVRVCVVRVCVRERERERESQREMD
ncbi:MAG TPA: hypothetical protein V6C97_02490 [Oculatellaceae cyanobacterium]